MMNRRLHLLFSISFIFLASTAGLAQSEHLGLWEGVDQTGKIGLVNFDSTGYAYFVLGQDTLGGESFIIEGYEAYMKYKVDYTAALKTMDFTIYLKENDMEVGKLPGIFKFDENDRLVLCVNFEGEDRPTRFKKDDTIELEKIGEADE